uniref:CW-type domain-containing protein n=1 Tax=Macrostomum lignano TaxID=282301 RepID=A0A1I8FIT9_9PLAT
NAPHAPSGDHVASGEPAAVAYSNAASRQQQQQQQQQRAASTAVQQAAKGEQQPKPRDAKHWACVPWCSVAECSGERRSHWEPCCGSPYQRHERWHAPVGQELSMLEVAHAKRRQAKSAKIRYNLDKST